MCFQREGRESDLQDLLNEFRYLTQDSAFLLDFVIGSMIASGKFEEAEDAVEKLKYIPDEDGRAARRTAQILMRRDRAYDRAVSTLDKAIESGKGSLAVNRATRAVAAAYANQRAKAKEDIEFVKQRMQNGQEVAKRLEAHLALANKSYDEAYAMIDSVKATTSFDRLLKARIYEAEASDPVTHISKRAELIERAERLRQGITAVADIDFNFFIN
jgi:tetratricopeptide (TPR) repeat protein